MADTTTDRVKKSNQGKVDRGLQLVRVWVPVKLVDEIKAVAKTLRDSIK